MKLNNKTITCYRDDARTIRRIKKAGGLKKSNDVIKILINNYLKTLPVETRNKILGVGYVARCKEIICK